MSEITFTDGNITLVNYNSHFEDNYISIDNDDYYLQPLVKGEKKTDGANSNVFILKDYNEEIEDRVIKICKVPAFKHAKNRSLARFRREIKAFRIAKKSNLPNVVEFFKSGEISVSDRPFSYVIMEKGSESLKSYMVRNAFQFTINQKLLFCVNILRGIEQLHGVGIYHRDIKHDNILLVNGVFKISDLGLVEFREQDSSIDYPNEKIGPVGWLSPEATNKMLTKGHKFDWRFDCDIDDKSDIFQLGKLFWYIFQGNLPIGQITNDDFLIDDGDLYRILFSMLCYKKDSRPTINIIDNRFAPIMLKYGV